MNLDKIKNFLVSLYILDLMTINKLCNYLLGLLLIVFLIELKREDWRKDKFLGYLLVFFLGMSLSLLKTYDLGNSISFIKKIAKILLSYLIISQIRLEKKKVIFVLILPLVYYAYRYFNPIYNYGGRFSALKMISHFSFYCYVIYSILISYLFYAETKVKEKLTLAAFLIPTIFFITISQTRGIYLALLIVTFINFLFKYPKKVLIGLVAFIFLFFIGGKISANYADCLSDNKYYERFKSSFDLKKNTSNLARIEVWKASYNEVKNRPIFGVGAGNFESIEKKHEDEWKYNKKYYHTHNIWLNLLVETGIVGSFTYLVMLVGIFIKGFQEFKAGNIYGIFTLNMVIGLEIYEMTEYLLWKKEPYTLVFVLMGIFLRSRYKKGAENEIELNCNSIQQAGIL